MKITTFLGILLSTAANHVCAATDAPTAPSAGHPLVGKWTWVRTANQCTEVYDFRADGRAPVQSGSERTDNVYTIAELPSANGFYRMTIRTTKDYGGKDCGDDESDSTGMESTNYILFSPDRSRHIVCSKPNLTACFGPLSRVRE